MVAEAGHGEAITIESSGMADWHTGKAPDSRAQAAARLRGIEISGLRAHQINVSDFHRFDYILGMDDENMADLAALCPAGREGRVHMMLDFADGIAVREVPDPYSGATGFDDVLDLIENASQGLLRHIIERDL
jgi:protein-tyrosine phosphatase